MGQLEILSIKPPEEVVTPKKGKKDKKGKKKATSKKSTATKSSKSKTSAKASSSQTSVPIAESHKGELEEGLAACIVAANQDEGKGGQDALQNETEVLASSSASATEPKKAVHRRLLPGNGIHTWRAELFAEVIELDSEENTIKVRLQDDLTVPLKRHHRRSGLPQWDAIELGSYWQVKFYPWLRLDKHLFSGVIFAMTPSSEAEFEAAKEAWHLTACFQWGRAIVQRDSRRIPETLSLKRTFVKPEGLSDELGLERGCYQFPITRNGTCIVLSGTPEPLVGPFDSPKRETSKPTLKSKPKKKESKTEDSETQSEPVAP